MSKGARTKEGDASYEESRGKCVGFVGAAAPNKGPPPLKLRRVNLRKMHKEYLEDKSNQRRARSPDDSAGEHNKGSGWTAA